MRNPDVPLRALVPPVLIGTKEEVRRGWRRVVREIIKADGDCAVGSAEDWVDVTDCDDPIFVRRCDVLYPKLRTVRTYDVLEGLTRALQDRGGDAVDWAYANEVYDRFVTRHYGTAWLMMARLYTGAYANPGRADHLVRREAWLQLREILRWWPWLMKNSVRLSLPGFELCPANPGSSPTWATGLGGTCKQMGVPDEVWTNMLDAGGVEAYHELMLDWVERYAPEDGGGMEATADPQRGK